jgi:transposase
MRPRRYPSDTTDAEWRILERMLPTPAAATPAGGRPETHPRREIVDAIRYLVDSGCKWRSLPADYPPFQTVYGFFARWARAGVFSHQREQLRRQLRIVDKRPRNPVKILIDSQSVKGAETVSKATRGYDAGKRINGRKRHLVTDSTGLPLAVMVTPANMHDAHAAREVLWRLRLTHPQLTMAWGDHAYGGTLITWADEFLGLTLKVAKNPAAPKAGFTVIPHRWVIERTNAWIMKARRNRADYERRPAHAEAMVTLALIRVMARRLARTPGTDYLTDLHRPWA